MAKEGRVISIYVCSSMGDTMQEVPTVKGKFRTIYVKASAGRERNQDLILWSPRNKERRFVE